MSYFLTTRQQRVFLTQGNTAIQPGFHLKYLAVWLDPKLTSADHIKLTFEKVSERFYKARVSVNGF